MKTIVRKSAGHLSDGEKRRLLELRRQAREIVSTVTDRIELETDSLDSSRRRFEEARTQAIVAMRLYHEALIVLAEDPDDDFSEAWEKREKFERIESEYLETGRVYESALNRLGWELRNSGAESA